MAHAMSDIQSGALWRSEYKPIPTDTVLVRQWSPVGAVRPLLEIIRSLPDSQKPHLPEGYIWSKAGDELSLLKHEYAPAPNFKIYIFGPDSKNRVQYVVVKEKTPMHGFAMAKREGFPKTLRDTFPMTTDAFKVKTTSVKSTTYWRGHIIDYPDTLGVPGDRLLSTLQTYNYKPEPEGYWARTLRFKIVEKLREEEGAYGEIMLYGFRPERTRNTTPIPEAVIVETFSYGKNSLGCYCVAKDDECHEWRVEGRKNFTKIKMRTLLQKEAFPALVWNAAEIAPEAVADSVTKDPMTLDVKSAYHLSRAAEMERSHSTNKLQYVIYSHTHGAPSEHSLFWLKRTVNMARVFDEACESKVPAFPLSLLNSLKEVFDATLLETQPLMKEGLENLCKIAERVAAVAPPLLVLSGEASVPVQARRVLDFEEGVEEEKAEPKKSAPIKLFFPPRPPAATSARKPLMQPPPVYKPLTLPKTPAASPVMVKLEPKKIVLSFKRREDKK